MPYERMRSIEARLERVLGLVGRGGLSARDIADELGVSIPTVARDIAALREQGYGIKAGRCGRTWEYSMESIPPSHPEPDTASSRAPALAIAQGRRS